jgi:hypothetical protein
LHAGLKFSLVRRYVVGKNFRIAVVHREQTFLHRRPMAVAVKLSASKAVRNVVGRPTTLATFPWRSGMKPCRVNG